MSWKKYVIIHDIINFIYNTIIVICKRSGVANLHHEYNHNLTL